MCSSDLTLDFTGAGAFRTAYSYRSNGEDDGLYLSEFTHQTIMQLELMIGFKGQFFERFDLLNASSISLMYQLSSMFKQEAGAITPLHFTWRFLF